MLSAPKLLAGPAQGQADPDPQLSVRLLELLHPQSLELRAAGGQSWRRLDLAGQVLRLDGARLGRWSSGPGLWWVRCGGVRRLYPGTLEFRPAPQGREIEVLLRVRLQDYVAGAAASEGGPHPRPAFAQALATLARYYALQHRGRHGDFDLCDTTHCQLFYGVDRLEGAWREAARHSGDLALKPGDQGPELLYHGTCGGSLDTARAVWGDGRGPAATPALDELDGRVLCRNSRFFRWRRRIPRSELAAAGAAAAGLPKGGLRLLDAEVSARTPGGRARLLDLRFLDAQGVLIERSVHMAGFQAQFGRRYGWDTLLSADFDARWDGDDWVLEGRGFGHGVGLCLEGAREMAALGYSAQEILGHYFPGRFVRVAAAPPLP